MYETNNKINREIISLTNHGNNHDKIAIWSNSDNG